MASKQLKTEGEVESFYVQPLLLHLGYAESDLSLKHKLSISQGAKSTYYEADLVVFDQDAEDEALLVVEAKTPHSILSSADVNQGRSYAQWLNAPLYLVTNAEHSRLYYNPPGLRPDCILEFDRDALGEQWPELVHLLSKESVQKLKEQIRERLQGLVQPLET